ncbi:MAG: precorrin-8X methylmutase [Alphaproteobacteria bacterium]|nr:precorrin-8X methylmutase [Alphaproteobacteria bacterium]
MAAGAAPSRPRYDYVHDPAEIYRRSVAEIRRAVDLVALPEDLRPVALRLVHASGMPDIVAELAASPGAATRGAAALKAGAPVLVDAEMVSQGIVRDALPADNKLLCALNGARVPALARELGTTRSAAAVELWRPYLEGAVVAIGNAPTALFHLLERLDEDWPVPALILGFPVGFVGAAESKAALAARDGVAFITLHGRRGGSAMAAAAVNALAAPDAWAA